MDTFSYLLGKKSSGGGGTNNIINTTVIAGTSSSLSGEWYNNLFALEGIKNITLTLDPTAQSDSMDFRYLFGGCNWAYLPKFVSNGELVNANLSYAFSNCLNITELDLSGVIATISRMQNCFYSCSKLMKLDIRGLVMSKMSSGSYYSSAFSSVPDNCLIIVKDNTEKTWVTTKFSNLTNVKTVEEYENG